MANCGVGKEKQAEFTTSISHKTEKIVNKCEWIILTQLHLFHFRVEHGDFSTKNSRTYSFSDFPRA